MRELLDVDNSFLPPIAVERESSLVFLVYLVRTFRALGALHVVEQLKYRNQRLESGDYWACALRTTHTKWRLQGIRI